MAKIDGDWLYKYRWWIGGGLALSVVGVVLYLNRKKVIKGVVELNKGIMEYAQNKVWDTVSERNIEKLHPKVRDKARELINRAEKELGIKLRAVSTLRTYAEQNELYAKGRTTAGSIVTNAKGGQSNHNFGTALDVVPIENGQPNWKSKDWDKIGALGKSIGFDWGGDFKSIVDKPHFEMQFGHTLAQLRSKYESGQRDGEYVKLA
jgi:hypothetical protein